MGTQSSPAPEAAQGRRRAAAPVRPGRPVPLRPDRPVPLRNRLDAMWAGGMSATAIRRALGLSEREAVACGMIRPRVAGAPDGAGQDRAGSRAEAPGGPRRRGGSGATRPAGPGASGPRMDEVLDAVARASGLRGELLLGRAQIRGLARTRQLVMYLLRDLCAGASLPAIGHFLGRDHSTVLYGCRRAHALLERDAAFRELHRRVCRALAR